MMPGIKKILLIFFVGLGIHRVIEDIILWIDPGSITRDYGYFSVISFIILYLIISYFKKNSTSSAVKSN